MSFLAPWAFWFAALVPVVIALYLLRVRRRSATVSSLLFWQRMMAEQRRRALFHKLRHPLSLLLQLAILALLVLALARPFFQKHRDAGAATLLLLDARMAMNARTAMGASEASEASGGQTRFDRAREMALREVANLGPGERIAVLIAAPGVRVEVPFTSDARRLREGIAGLKVTDAGGDLGEAVRDARTILASAEGPTRLVVYSDRTADRIGEGLAADEVVAIPGATVNSAIVGFAARPIPGSPQTLEVFLELANFSNGATREEVEIALDGKPLEIRTIDVGQGARKQETFRLLLSGGIGGIGGTGGEGLLEAKLTKSDGLATDNRAYAVVASLKKLRVLLVSNGNWFLERLLLADESVVHEFLSPADFSPAMAKGFDAVILDGAMSKVGEMAEGNFLVLGGDANGARMDTPVAIATASDHPVMRRCDLEGVRIFQASPLALPAAEGWNFQTLVESEQGVPLLVAGERAPHRWVGLGFGVTDADLPLRVAFPLLMSNALHWLAGDLEGAAPTGDRAGRTDRPDRNGFSKLESKWIATNTFDAAQSDLRETAKGEVRDKTAWLLRRSSLPFWWILALGAFLLLVLEWVLFHRRQTE